MEIAMIVICRSNDPISIPEAYRSEYQGSSEAGQLPLLEEKAYVVYAVTFNSAKVKYLICDEVYEKSLGLYYPRFWPAPLFSIEDSSLSGYWRLAFTPEHSDHDAILAYPEWISDPYYYDRLTEGSDNEVSQFRRYMHCMDSEARSEND